MAFAFFLLGYFLFNERPRTFRSLVCTSLTLFCSDTLLAGYRSSVRYLLFFFPSDLPSVAFSALWRILPLLGFLYRSHANHARKPPSEYFFSVLVFSNFFRLSPRRGKESSLFIPSFSLFFGRVPAVFCRPLTAPPISSLEFSSILFMKAINIFCSFLSFFNFIIADFSRLSRGF